MLSPAIGAMRAALQALKAGASQSEEAIPGDEFRRALGYDDYAAAAKPFML